MFFTTLAPFKGLELLLEAFQALHMEFPQLRLTIAGTEHTRFPNYARDLRARFNGISGVQWLGQVLEDDVKDLFRRALIWAGKLKFWSAWRHSWLCSSICFCRVNRWAASPVSENMAGRPCAG